jgi:hypothetical protein
MEQAVKGKLGGVKMEVSVVSDFHCGNLDLPETGFAVSFNEQVSSQSYSSGHGLRPESLN